MDSNITTNLIEIIDDELRISHRIISKNTDNDEDSISRLIRKHGDSLELFGRIGFQIQSEIEVKLKQKENPNYRPEKTFYLNESQATLLLTFMRNNEIVIKFKIRLVREFYEMKKVLFAESIPEPLSEKANCWGNIRLDGKKGRLTFTDSIQLFIKYAKSQGSQHSENYYHLFTDNIYLKLGFLSSKKDLIQLKKMKKETGFNFRNILSTAELSLISIAEITIAQIINEEMENETSYKNIFIIAQTQLIKYAEAVKPSLPNPKNLLDFDKNLFTELE